MPDNIRPVNYNLTITPDLDHFRFNGQVIIEFEADAPVAQVALDILELAVWQCRFINAHTDHSCAFTLIPAEESLKVNLPQPTQGRFKLQIDYSGKINDQMAGFYRSGYTHQGQSKYIAVTQFQESSARQAFPCMDHPLHKATFDLALVVPKDLAVIANTPAVGEQRVSETLKQVTFERTPIMSTYLLFFGVGQFEFVQDSVDPRVRVATLPGLQHTTELGLTFGRKALHYCENYYGIDYPLKKMDLIAVPDFAFGAMENWGAITFRENLLLHFADTTSAEGVERICEVIAHEIAHQWFGNLVTPADWKYLWLNESFATYFGYGVVAHTHPEWGTWDQFLHSQTATALSRDGLAATFPIELPGGAHVVINSSTAPIIYNKGASMLRMIEGYIGHDHYQNGVRRYLKRHTYACAQSHHLWEAFEATTTEPITAMVQSWIDQPGYPLVHVRRQADTLTLSQERFTYLPHTHEQSWMIPVTLTCWSDSGQNQTQAFIMESATTTLELPQDIKTYKINAGQTGFYRAQYHDEQNLAALAERVKDATLPHTDRWGLQNDLYALVRAGRLPLSRYLEWVAHYEDETQYLPLAGIAGHLQQAEAISAAPERGPIQIIGRALAQRVLEHIGMAPAQEEPHTRAALRNQLLWQAVAWGAPKAEAFAVDRFEQMMTGQKIHPDIARSVMQAGARKKGKAALDWLKQQFGRSPSEHERMNILVAMAAFDQWALIDEALAFTLDAVPPRNQFVPIMAAAGNPVAVPLLWEWYQQHLNKLETFHPLLYERVITGIVPLAGLQHREQVKTFFSTYIEQKPQLKDAIDLALENLDINARMHSGFEMG